MEPKEWNFEAEEIAVLNNEMPTAAKDSFTIIATKADGAIWEWALDGEPEEKIAGDGKSFLRGSLMASLRMGKGASMGSILFGMKADGFYLYKFFNGDDFVARIPYPAAISTPSADTVSAIVPAEQGNIQLLLTASTKRTEAEAAPDTTATSHLYYTSIDLHTGSHDAYMNWGSHYTGRPAMVEGSTTLWVFATYTKPNGEQYLRYCYRDRNKHNWGTWHSFQWVGKKRITSLTGGTGRQASGSYSLCVTDGDKAYNIITTGDPDGWPVLNENTPPLGKPYDKAIARYMTCSRHKHTVSFFHQIGGKIYEAFSWPKESVFAQATGNTPKSYPFAVPTYANGPTCPLVYNTGTQVVLLPIREEEANPIPG